MKRHGDNDQDVYIAIKSSEEIEKMRKAGEVVAGALQMLGQYVKPGITTGELDRIAEEYVLSYNALPAFKGYEVDGRIFPATLCISIDEQVVHGIPGDRELKEGEIVSFDCGASIDGYFADSAYTYGVGEISEGKSKLLKITEEALYLGIAKAIVGNKLYDISKAIQTHCESNGFSLTRELVGHGIGTHLHEEPPVPNFVPPLLRRDQYPNVKLRAGMAIAIEPMVHLGKKEVITKRDGWTVVTADNSPAAHFEHTVIIQENEPIIITKWK